MIVKDAQGREIGEVTYYPALKSSTTDYNEYWRATPYCDDEDPRNFSSQEIAEEFIRTVTGQRVPVEDNLLD